MTNNFAFKYDHKAWNVKTDEWLGNLCKAVKTKH